MKKNSGYYFELVVVVLVTLIVFTALTIPHLQHGVGFIFPVPLAIFIIRYRVKDGIIPALIMLFFAPIITHFLPIGEGSWVRGLLMMLTAVTIGFLHGGLSKLKISHLREIIIVIGAEMVLAFLTTAIFYLIKDPVFDYSVEFPHYFERFAALFNLNHESIYAQNVRFIFVNSVIPYIIALAIVEVLFTHILIFLVIRYAFELTDGRPFTGLYFKIKKPLAYLYLFGLGTALISLFFLNQTLSQGVLIAITVLFNLVLGAMIFFILQGVMVMILLFRTRRNRERSIILFIIALIFSIPFSIFGAFNVIFDWTSRMMAAEQIEHF
ncbi:MAG: hypothetical protein WCY90_01930 [Bacilli bacterium]